jgi:Alternative complex III, ActD subunit
MSQSGVLASFEHHDSTVNALKKLRSAGFKDVTTYTPYPDHDIEHALGYKESPVRVFALVGGLSGAAAGLAFTSFTSLDWPLLVGGKPMLSIPAFVPIIFETAVLFGALSTVIGLFINAKLPSLRPMVVYDPDFSNGRFGVFVRAEGDRLTEAHGILQAEAPAELRGDADA